MVRTVRAVARHGKLELLEPLDLEDGQTVEVTITIPEANETEVPERRPALRSPWHMGARVPLTRDAIHGDPDETR